MAGAEGDRVQAGAEGAWVPAGAEGAWPLTLTQPGWCRDTPVTYAPPRPQAEEENTG